MRIESGFEKDQFMPERNIGRAKKIPVIRFRAKYGDAHCGSLLIMAGSIPTLGFSGTPSHGYAAFHERTGKSWR
ncbi:MAG: hypothetical protein Kow0040_09740 [Thermogutta sp.]